MIGVRYVPRISFVSVIHSLLLFIGNIETEDILKNPQSLDPSEPFWDEPFGMSRLLAGDLHRSLKASFGKCST